MHFGQILCILALFPKVTTIHVLVISISWELLELILPYKWANESFLNKFADVLFNLFGFHVFGFSSCVSQNVSSSLKNATRIAR